MASARLIDDLAAGISSSRSDSAAEKIPEIRVFADRLGGLVDFGAGGLEVALGFGCPGAVEQGKAMLLGLEAGSGQRLVERQRPPCRAGRPQSTYCRPRPAPGRARRVACRRQLGRGCSNSRRRIGEAPCLARLDRAAGTVRLDAVKTMSARIGRRPPVPAAAVRQRGERSCNSLHEPVQLDQDRVDLVRLAQAMPGSFDQSKLDIG